MTAWFSIEVADSGIGTSTENIPGRLVEEPAHTYVDKVDA